MQKRKFGKCGSALLFLLLILCLTFGLSAVGNGNKKKQMENLEQALNRIIVYAYAVEGAYPESLSAMKERFGLTYDEGSFYVDYRVIAPNLYPEVTILTIGGDT